jgi:uncharacterized SAM-binding protein YcdF (DUF218 family)
VIVSGAGDVPRIMAEVLISSGVPVSDILIDDNSLNTAESAKYVFQLLGRSPFLLVTSAGHMPRAMKVFEKVGANPRPVPTHYMTRKNWLAVRYLPSPEYLYYSDLAISEYSALIWYRLKGWV